MITRSDAADIRTGIEVSEDLVNWGASENAYQISAQDLDPGYQKILWSVQLSANDHEGFARVAYDLK
jgi:hypothetical protein